MNSAMLRLKDKLYYYLVDKNWGVGPEYHRYVDTHPEEHANNRWKSWWLLLRLNWHYRVLRNTKPLLATNIAKNNRRDKRKLPYLDGAESEVSKRREVIHFAKDLLQYDVVSFDIFDTLILRPFADPKDLFMIIGDNLGFPNFFKVRIEAEKLARERAAIYKGNREVTIGDIYDVVQERIGIDKEIGVETELEAEKRYCFANPYMKQVFNLLQEMDKTIIIVSDMYIQHKEMERLLENVGYTGYDKLYVSCDYNCSKRTGGLYQYVKRDYSGKKIVHIGDNVASDIQAAQKENLDVRYYKNCHEIGNQYRADGMSELVGSAYAGIVNTHLHNGIKTYSPYYEYGFIYGGLYILGFCNWIHKKAKKEGIDKVLFLSRDGDIYQKVFNMMFDDVPNEYFLWSRIANVKYTATINRYDFLKRNLYDRTNEVQKITVGRLLEIMSLEKFECYLSRYNISKDSLVLKENITIIEKMFIENWSEVRSELQKQFEEVSKYIKYKIGKSKKVAFVDVGWRGSSATGLKKIIEQILGLECKVLCWQAGVYSVERTEMDTLVLAEVVEPYIFSRMLNRNLYDQHLKTNKGLNCVFFELFTQATYPSFVGFSIDGRFMFDVPEVENKIVIQEVHQGIIDFCTLYSDKFIYDIFMINVQGFDAYCPYRIIIRDLKLIKKYFAEFVYVRMVGSNFKSIEKLIDLIKRHNL